MVCVSVPAAEPRCGTDCGSLAGVPDFQFSQILTERLARLLRADLVAVAERCGPGRMRVAAGWFDGQGLEGFDYASQASPCGAVIRSRRPLLLAGTLQQRFPQDAVLLAENIRSYAGLPLLLPGGGVAGVLHAAWRGGAGQGLTARALAAMEPYAARLSAVLAARREGAALTRLASRPGGAGPQASLRWLASELGAVSGARAVVIAAPGPRAGGGLQVAACWADGALQTGAEGAALPLEAAGRPGGGHAGKLEAAAAQLLAARGNLAAGDAPPMAKCRGQLLHGRRGALAGGFVLLGDAALTPLGTVLGRAFATQIRCQLRRLSARGLRLHRRRAHRHGEKRAGLARLAGGIAHDLGDALSAMQGQADLALAYSGAEPLRGQATAQLRLLRQGLGSAAALLHPLLDYADGPRGTEQADGQARCDLNAGVRAAAGAVPELVQLDLSPGPLPVLGAADGLLRLVRNLLQNAREALPPGSEASLQKPIRVATACAPPGEAGRAALLGGDCLPRGRYARLEVRDDGCGISAAALGRIFDPYFTTRPGRRGLGLAPVAGFLHRYGGAVAVDSAPGRGSCFRLYFPLAGDASPAAAAGPAARRPASAGVRRILVADDEETVCRAVAGLLRIRGCAVELAGDHEAALEILRRSGPLAGAVIDLNLAGHCGWHTLSGLRALQPDLPCVVMSGFPVSAAAAGFPELAGVEVLQKPFCKDQLYRAVLR